MAKEAEIGIMQLQAKECRQPLEAEQGKKQVLLWRLQKELALLTP